MSCISFLQIHPAKPGKPFFSVEMPTKIRTPGRAFASCARILTIANSLPHRDNPVHRSPPTSVHNPFIYPPIDSFGVKASSGRGDTAQVQHEYCGVPRYGQVTAW